LQAYNLVVLVELTDRNAEPEAVLNKNVRILYISNSVSDGPPVATGTKP
jgi:hypothetical protein